MDPEFDQNLISKDKLPYRQGVYALIIDNTTKSVLLVHKKNSKDWGFPGGGVEKNTSLEETISRELKEELGLEKFNILHQAVRTYKYDWPFSEIRKNLKKYGKLMRGQEQHYFIIGLEGTDRDIKLQHEELSEYKWVRLPELNLYIAYKDLLDYVCTVFRDYGIDI